MCSDIHRERLGGFKHWESRIETNKNILKKKNEISKKCEIWGKGPYTMSCFKSIVTFKQRFK